MKEIKHIVIFVLPHSTLINMAAPLDVFTRAIIESAKLSNPSNFIYQVHVVTEGTENHVVTSSGLSIVVDGGYETIDYPIDTLIVSGLPNHSDYQVQPQTLKWIYDQSKKIRRICSICAGAFLLAEAGVLDGKRATTHWNLCENMAKEYPNVHVEIAPLFVKDGNTYTSAGVSSGLDLSLALVEEDMGKAFALQIAKLMVLFLKRPGNQVQYSNLMAYQNIPNLSIRKSCEWIFNHLKEDLPVERIAEEVDMSPRNFARVFAREMNITPAKYIDRLRVDRATQDLVESQYSFDQIGERCGVKNADNLRRLFLKILETTPSAYRNSFAGTP